MKARKQPFSGLGLRAWKNEGGELTPAQIESALAVMEGEFAGTKSVTALEKAGVVFNAPAANTLIIREVKTGRVLRVSRGLCLAA